MIRINKYLAQCGLASRRTADIIVSAGRVTVNGKAVDTPGYMVDEASDEVKVDGVLVRPVGQHTYIVLNKPAGYVTSLSDPHHERTVIDLVRDVGIRVYPVGRLDLDTEGVLLLTSDGEFAHRLTHPRFGISKIYRAHIKGRLSRDETALLEKGMVLPDGQLGRARVRVESARGEYSDLVLELTEGRKREVKHLCRAVGHPVISLVRISFAGIECGRLKKGEWRHLTATEISRLKKKVGLA